MKDLSQVVRLAVDSLGAHKLRSFLTMLGVIIGVAAVVSMLSIGEGAEEEILEQISILGINNIIVNARVPEEAIEAEEGLQRSRGLSMADSDNIMEFGELVANTVPQRFEPIPTVRYGVNEANVRVVATTPDFVCEGHGGGRAFHDDRYAGDGRHPVVAGEPGQSHSLAEFCPCGRRI